MGGDAQALRQLLGFAQPLGLGHRLHRNIAHRDVAAFSNQLPRQFAAHARAASGDDGEFSGEILHGGAYLGSVSELGPSCARRSGRDGTRAKDDSNSCHLAVKPRRSADNPAAWTWHM